MVPAIRNILGGFLFSGDDVYKKAGVLSGGERTRLAVARMLLRPSNTLLLDEPTNHLDLDSKDVLLDALEDYGGTLIIVSHDRYFVEKLATKIIEIGHGEALVYPGHLHGVPLEQGAPKDSGSGSGLRAPGDQATANRRAEAQSHGSAPKPKARAAEARSPRARVTRGPQAAGGRARRRSSEQPRRCRSGLPISRVAHRGARSAGQGARGDDGGAGSTTTSRRPSRSIDRHQALMWEVGDLMAPVGSAAGARAEPSVRTVDASES